MSEDILDIAPEELNLRSSMQDPVEYEPEPTWRERVTSTLPPFPNSILKAVSDLNTELQDNHDTKLAGRQVAGALNTILAYHRQLEAGYNKAANTDQNNISISLQRYCNEALSSSTSRLQRIIHEERERLATSLAGVERISPLPGIDKTPIPAAVVALVKCGLITKPKELCKEMHALPRTILTALGINYKDLPSPYSKGRQLRIDGYDRGLAILYKLDAYINELKAHVVVTETYEVEVQK